MMQENMNLPSETEWFAVKVRQDFKAESLLTPLCEEVLFPKYLVSTSEGRRRIKAVIPHVLFVKTTKAKILELEKKSKENSEQLVPFWIYRYPNDKEIQVITENSIHLLHLLTSDDTTKCEIYNKNDFKKDQQVRIMGGRFEGYEGFVVRVKKNKHVVVKIDGICMVLLPFIHPDFLEPIS